MVQDNKNLQNKTAIENNPKYIRKDLAIAIFVGLSIGQALANNFSLTQPLGIICWGLTVLLFCFAFWKSFCKRRFKTAAYLGFCTALLFGLGFIDFSGWCDTHSCSIVTGSPPWGTKISKSPVNSVLPRAPAER